MHTFKKTSLFLISIHLKAFTNTGQIKIFVKSKKKIRVMSWHYKKHIDASVKERPQTLLVPSEEIYKRDLCNKHMLHHLFQTEQFYLCKKTMHFVNSTLFSVLFTTNWNKKLNKMYWCPEVCIYTEIYPNIWKVYLNYSNLKNLDSFILASRDNWVSCNQTLGCLHLYGDRRVLHEQCLWDIAAAWLAVSF